MNKYVRKFFGVLFQSNSTQKILRIQTQHLPTSSEEWHAHWQKQGQPWRAEPEISLERQQELSNRRTIIPDIEKGIYPFKDVKLKRADMEWLLATHENGRGPVDWSNESQREREGLDVRGADLRQVNLSNFPLACLCGGLQKYEWSMLIGQHAMYTIPEGQRMMIAMFLAQAVLIGAHLEGCNLAGAHLEGAYLCDVHLERAYLFNAHLEGAELAWAHLEGADLTWAHLERVDLTGAYLEGVDLDNAILAISGDKQGIGPRLVDVHWGETNLALVDWSQVKKLGDEHEAQQKKTSRGKAKGKAMRLSEYQTAARANRQLAIALLDQGLNGDATRFAYRAQVLQKSVFRFQISQSSIGFRPRVQALGAWFFSWFLFLLAGYGYRLWRSFLAYVLVIMGFTTTYYLLGGSFKPPLSLVNALGLSMTSFHGRGFFPGVTQLNDTLTILASLEAFVGLILEATFIATLTQRFFGK